jgi:hypothetical protein
MVVDMMIFAFMAHQYTFANHKHNDEDAKEEDKNNEKVNNNVKMLERNGVDHKAKQ